MELSSKKNPLFLDSTKPIGGKVVTKLELLISPDELEAYEGAAVFIEVIDQFGFAQKFSLKKTERRKKDSVRIENQNALLMTAEIWLKYQYQIHYRFVLVREEVILASTQFQQTSAGHFISDKWMECAEKDLILPKVAVQANRRAEFMEGLKQQKEERAGKSKGLVESSQLEQLKSLLKDLL